MYDQSSQRNRAAVRPALLGLRHAGLFYLGRNGGCGEVSGSWLGRFRTHCLVVVGRGLCLVIPPKGVVLR